MASQRPKKFFREPTVDQIKRRKQVSSSGNLPYELLNLREGEYLVIAEPLLPEKFRDEPRKFLKHGPEVPVHTFRTAREAIEEMKAPWQLRTEAYDKPKIRNSDIDFSAISYRPLLGNDKRRRRLSLVQGLEGSRLFSYARKSKKTDIDIDSRYDNSRAVWKDGANVLISVPSATEGHSRWGGEGKDFTFTGVPLVDSPRKYALAHSFGSTHICPFKTFRDLRYTQEFDREGSQVLHLCKHDVAGWNALVDHYWNSPQHNSRPLEMSQIPLPSKMMAEAYKRMLDSVLVYDENSSRKDKLRKPNQAEEQVMLDRMVREYGADETIFARSDRDGNIADYDWGLRNLPEAA